MKIRNGFVSNSSSSSFLLYGAIVEKITKENASEKLLKEFEETSREDYPTFEDFMEDQMYEIGERPFDDEVYIGLSWSSVKDNETGLQFKERCKKHVAEFIKDVDKLKFETHKEEYQC